MKSFFKILIIILVVLSIICISLYIVVANGINIHSIKYSRGFLSSESIKIECYAIANYSVEMIDSSSPIYLGENKNKEFNELGAYRFKIVICDSNPSKKFKKQFKRSTVCDLPNNNQFKFIYINTENHATEFYIGSDTPFTVEKQEVGGKEKLIETITIPVIY